MNSRLLLIQQLIPIGLLAVEEALRNPIKNMRILGKYLISKKLQLFLLHSYYVNQTVSEGCDLNDQEIIAIFMDGKSFAQNEMIIALGVTFQGEKVILGMVESQKRIIGFVENFSIQRAGIRDENKLLFIKKD